MCQENVMRWKKKKNHKRLWNTLYKNIGKVLCQLWGKYYEQKF